MTCYQLEFTFDGQNHGFSNYVIFIAFLWEKIAMVIGCHVDMRSYKKFMVRGPKINFQKKIDCLCFVTCTNLDLDWAKTKYDTIFHTEFDDKLNCDIYLELEPRMGPLRLHGHP